MCIVYIAHMGTVVLIVKISFIRFEDKLYTFCTLCLRILFTFHIYLNTISYQVAAGQITWARKRAISFIRKFYIFMSFFKIENL